MKSKARKPPGSVFLVVVVVVGANRSDHVHFAIGAKKICVHTARRQDTTFP